jgi:hypothetical protein
MDIFETQGGRGALFMQPEKRTREIKIRDTHKK